MSFGWWSVVGLPEAFRSLTPDSSESSTALGLFYPVWPFRRSIAFVGPSPGPLFLDA